MRLSRENIAAVCLFLFVLLLSLWLQFWLLEDIGHKTGGFGVNEFDYYMENVTMTGVDDEGIAYRMTSDRMEHYPVGDRSLLDNPHVTRYWEDGSPQHAYADSGWFDGVKNTVLLIGNVRVNRHPADGAGEAVTSEKIMIRLDGSDG